MANIYRAVQNYVQVDQLNEAAKTRARHWTLSLENLAQYLSQKLVQPASQRI